LKKIPSKIVNRLGFVFTANLVEKDGKKYMEIIIQAFINVISYQGKYYIRSGCTTRELNGAKLYEFLLEK